jgi:hypothetical protein
MWVSGFMTTGSSRKLPRLPNPSGNAGIALKYIGKLYKIENSILFKPIVKTKLVRAIRKIFDKEN